MGGRKEDDQNIITSIGKPETLELWNPKRELRGLRETLPVGHIHILAFYKNSLFCNYSHISQKVQMFGTIRGYQYMKLNMTN